MSNIWMCDIERPNTLVSHSLILCHNFYAIYEICNIHGFIWTLVSIQSPSLSIATLQLCYASSTISYMIHMLRCLLILLQFSIFSSHYNLLHFFIVPTILPSLPLSPLAARCSDFIFYQSSNGISQIVEENSTNIYIKFTIFGKYWFLNSFYSILEPYIWQYGGSIPTIEAIGWNMRDI